MQSRLLELAAYFLWIGATGYGEPVALVDCMHRDLVVRRKWFDDETYREAGLFAIGARTVGQSSSR